MQGKFLLSILTVFICTSVCRAATEIHFKPPNAWQGKTLVVQVKSTDEAFKSIEAFFLNKKVNFFPTLDGFKEIIGIPLNQKPGKYVFHLNLIRLDGSSLEVENKINVWPTKYKQVIFYLPTAKQKIFTNELIQKEWEQIEKVLTLEVNEQRWNGVFIPPVPGIITMDFGVRELINGRKPSQHKGTDFRAALGTEVAAPNAGSVVFAEELRAYGGTLVLDHGQGIHTLYFHLSKIIAKLGQKVKKGQLIALTGNSGISNGPHLHLGMSVHNLRVDPLQWLKEEM